MYQSRVYRKNSNDSRFKYFRVQYKHSDLLISVDRESYNDKIPYYVNKYLKKTVKELETYIKDNPEFGISFIPIELKSPYPNIAKKMDYASKLSGIGPMASVAGTIAEEVCNEIIDKFNVSECIVENGGDIFLKVISETTISIHLGNSLFSDKFGIVIKPNQTPCAICTSSAKLGHSFSFGNADGVVIKAKSGAVADSFATAFCNEIKVKDDINKVIDLYEKEESINGIIATIDDSFLVKGDIEILHFHKILS